MNRQMMLLAGLAAVLVIVGWFFFLFNPKNEEIAEIEDEIETTEQQIAQVEQQIAQLEQVRAEAPELEAALAAAEAIIPREPLLPSVLRQLQLAADDSGVTLVSVTPGRPAAADIAEAPAGLASLTLSASIEGGYFQVVDFLRRIEDPAITARGILWDSAALAPSDYPTLTGTLTGRMFSLLPEAPAEEEAEQEQPPPSPDEAQTEAEPA